MPSWARPPAPLPGAHLGGDSSAIFELDLLGLAKGVVYSYTWCDDWRTTSWVSVLFSGAPGTMTYYTFDGIYQAYLPAGTWKMDVIPWTEEIWSMPFRIFPANLLTSPLLYCLVAQYIIVRVVG